MKSAHILSLLITTSLFAGCNETIYSLEEEEQKVSSVEAILDPITKENWHVTRVSPTDKGDGHYSFGWQANDKIAIYGQTPNSSGWGFFQLSGDGGDAAGVFSGIFKMTNETTYYSFYPPQNFTSETTPSTIMLDYTGQTQMEDGDMSHMRNYIYYAAAQADDSRFKFKHVGALLKIVMPDDHEDDCIGVKLSTTGSGQFVIKGQIDLTTTTTSQAPAITPIETSDTFSVGYSHGSSANTGTITIYAMIAPTDLSSNSLSVTALHNHPEYDNTYYVPSQNFQAGKPYSIDGIIPYLTFKSAVQQTFKMSDAVATLEYSVNGREWTELGTNTVTFGGSYGDLKLRGKSSMGTASGATIYSKITFGNNSKPVSCSGDIRTLVDYENYQTADCSNARFCCLFKDCASLITAPKLPATTLASYAYCNMFWNCTSLASAPDLPATNLAYECYSCMFCNCTSLNNVPARLPATTLASLCYENMFEGCSALTTAPELPAETLTNSCYIRMFKNCSSLENAPALPATELNTSCYATMFQGCTSLQTAPELPATTLASGCYQFMFSGCTSLTSAPELPATSLAERCYNEMFINCSSLSEAPNLPAITLATGCYGSMFYGCSSLQTAPDLPALTLANNCYSYMFYQCLSLNYIKMMATDISATNCLYYWTSGVRSSGTFIKNSAATWNESGSSGIPYGWTIREENPNMIDGHEYVDLGLSVKWATCNVGADAPEEYGDYFAWGETEPKNSYSQASYKWISSDKYRTGHSGLDRVDDAAYVNWGGNWRMPTKEEQDELKNRSNCSWEWTTVNGVSGYLVTSLKPGYTDKSIFLPAAGYYYEDIRQTSLNIYWSSTIVSYNKDYAFSIYFDSNYSMDMPRYEGASVRAVCP